jgi:serine protease AprX
VKPDVSACGVYVLAPKAAHTGLAWDPPYPDYAGQYAFLGGTSMAAPVVSGLAAIVRQYLRVERAVLAPSAALLKSILIAAAERSRALTVSEGDPHGDYVGYPDFHQGFGRVDLSRVMAHAQMPAGRKLVFDDVANNSPRALRSHASTGDRRYYSVTVAPDCPEALRIVLTWTDFPGRGIQNNLNLWVDGPNRSLFIGNRALVYKRDPIFDVVSRDGTPFDKRNNVEHLSIAKPEAGEYIIRVLAQSTPMGEGQGYALCVAGCLETDLLPG